MRVMFTGSRNFKNLELVTAVTARLRRDVEVIVGDARGVDTAVANLVSNAGGNLKVYKADWGTYGKRAGILRNLEMLDAKPDAVIGFWDGESRGTQHVINEALKRKIQLRIYFDRED